MVPNLPSHSQNHPGSIWKNAEETTTRKYLMDFCKGATLVIADVSYNLKNKTQYWKCKNQLNKWLMSAELSLGVQGDQQQLPSLASSEPVFARGEHTPLCGRSMRC
jgi:hypothetical protein